MISHTINSDVILFHITQKTTEAAKYECGYLVLIGDHDKLEKSADNEENPYYHKLEQEEKVTKTSSTENPSRK